jgi:hypothetical protein
MRSTHLEPSLHSLIHSSLKCSSSRRALCGALLAREARQEALELGAHAQETVAAQQSRGSEGCRGGKRKARTC